MATPTTSERLAHILEAIDQIERNTQGLTPDAFRSARFLQLGVERCLEIISEASRHVPDQFKAKHSHLEWRRIGDIGNRLRHAYHAVDSDIVWEILTHHLGPLRAAIEEMMRDQNSPE